MTREERNNLSRVRIMSAALHEFGEKSYAEASINTISEQDGISKGNVYHYFTDKDTLYLACAKVCFEAIMEYITAHLPPTGQGADCDLQAYFEVRRRFFEENPHYQTFFYQISSTAPVHLLDAIKEIRAPFDHFNIAAFSAILNHATLRPGVTMDEVVIIHLALQNALVSSEQVLKPTLDNPMARENLTLHWMDILLHGVIEKT